MRSLALSAAATTCLLAGHAAGQSFSNADFATGDLSSWQVTNTANGVGAPGTVQLVDIDGPGPLGLSEAGSFQVGQAVFTSGVQEGIQMIQGLSLTGGTLYTFEFDCAAINTNTVNNAQGGVFSLIVDDVIIASFAAGSTSATTPRYGHVTAPFTPPVTGVYRVGARITRPYVSPGTLTQYVDNFRPAGATAPTGACCLPDGSCVVVSNAGCTTANGIYRGDGAPCATANCPQPATGACCLIAGCQVLTQAQCTAQNGNYAGDNVTCAAANCPAPCADVTGMIGGPATGWPVINGIQDGRLFRDGVPDTCAAPGVVGAPFTGSYAYDQFDFMNGSAAAVCVQVDIDTACTGTNFIYAGAYIGGFDRTNITLNNVASIGGSPNPTASMSFVVPASTAFQLVFAEVTPGAGCPSYHFLVTGLANCGTSVPCYANCDGSSIPPILNVSDFICFQTKYAAGDPYANCDGSTVPPVLNVSDFICYQTKYAAGCS